MGSPGHAASSMHGYSCGMQPKEQGTVTELHSGAVAAVRIHPSNAPPQTQKPIRTPCDGQSPAQKKGLCNGSSLIQNSLFFPLNHNSAGRKQLLSHPFSSVIKERKSNTNQRGSEDVKLDGSSLDQGRDSCQSRSKRTASKAATQVKVRVSSLASDKGKGGTGQTQCCCHGQAGTALSLPDRKASQFGKLILCGRKPSKVTEWSVRNNLKFLCCFSQ